jgi:fructokinase
MRTPSAVVTLDDDGRASYAFDIEWTLPAQTLQARTPPAAGHVHIGSIAAVAAPGAAATLALAESLRAQATVSYDPNVRPALMGDRTTAVERVERCVAVADVVKASDEDLRWLFPGSDDMDGTAARWLALGPSVVIVTLGETGAVAYTHDHVVSIKARATTVVDTVGAGDSFMAATLHALSDLSRADLASLTPDTLRRLLDHGTAAAALTVSRAGANPPDLTELAAALGDVRGR